MHACMNIALIVTKFEKHSNERRPGRLTHAQHCMTWRAMDESISTYSHTSHLTFG